MSWYPNQTVTEKEYKYLKLLQAIWKVQNPRKEWVPYMLQPHQIEWHKDDVTIQRQNCKNRLVIKSRNTSFTTSSLISNLMAVPSFPEQIIPFIRLNMTRANDLLSECKRLIKHMTPVRIGDRLYPFDPNKVNMDSMGRIIFTEYDVEFRAFPATNASAENIRGLRITGSAGIIDESNFMKDYANIYIACRDAAAGIVDGQKIFQMNIGTTLKGLTPFKLWHDRIKLAKEVGLKEYRWPVFDMSKVNFDEQFVNQKLEPIVSWHNIEDLQLKYNEDSNTFLEEYCCVVVPDEMSLYPLSKVMELTDDKLRILVVPDETVEDLSEFYIGVDPSGEGQDYSTIVIFEKKDDRYIERYLYYDRSISLESLQNKISKLIEVWHPVRCRIDANGLGYQLGQTLKQQFGSVVELIRGSATIKSSKTGSFIPFKEFQHTNLIHLINNKQIYFVQDEMQYIHFSVWDRRYEAPSTREYGHGDIVSAICLACLPNNWRYGGGDNKLIAKTTIDKSFDINNVLDRVKYYDRISKLRG